MESSSGQVAFPGWRLCPCGFQHKMGDVDPQHRRAWLAEQARHYQALWRAEMVRAFSKSP